METDGRDCAMLGCDDDIVANLSGRKEEHRDGENVAY